MVLSPGAREDLGKDKVEEAESTKAKGTRTTRSTSHQQLTKRTFDCFEKQWKKYKDDANKKQETICNKQ